MLGSICSLAGPLDTGVSEGLSGSTHAHGHGSSADHGAVMGSAVVRLRSCRAALLWWQQVCADDVIVL